MKIQNGLHQCLHFNSRPHGGRPRRCGGRHNRRYFNSRPHGGRHTSKELAPRRMVFQLTPSRRATEAGGIFVLIFKISTHALTEGDVISPRNTAIGMLFQLTPSRRATIPSVSDASPNIFQLTPSRRATGNRAELRIRRKFQLTPSRRATSCIIEKIKHYKDFNSRPHGGRP